jgi:hypothetical protein
MIAPSPCHFGGTSKYSNRSQISVADQHQMAALLSGLNTVLYIANRFKVYYTFIAQISEGQARTNFKTALIDLQVRILIFLAEAIQLYQEHSFLRHLKAIWGSEATSSFDSECNEISKRAEVEAHNCGRSLILDMREKLKSLEDVKESVAKLLSEFELSKLTLVEGASFDSHDEEYNSLCLDNTRVGLRLQIAQWVNDPHGKCIFWLNGMAGTGKSTISRTIARAFRDKDQLGASFFFKRGESDRNDARKLFTTIAAQLSYSLPAIVPSILDAIKSGYAISGKALKEQFENLILGPLHTVPERRSAVVIVIDALDECENEADMKNTLCLLARLEELKLVRLRIFLTSRPEKGIIDTFLDIRGDEYPDVALEGIPTTQKDLSAYFTNEFAKMKRKPIRDGPNWPGDVVIGELARMAEPSFIFAATICRFVNDEDESPERQLEIMRGSKFASSQASQLDQTYLPVLNQLKRNPRLEKQYHTLLETIVLLADPLSAPALAALLKTDEMDLEIIRLRLQRLHSVLRIPANEVSPVRIFHLSFREFLVDPQKRDKHWFWVDEQEAHERIARKCLELMSRDGALKRNPCGFKEPGVARSEVDRRVVDEHLSSEVQYACRYWVYHVEKSNGQFSDVPAVLVFLQTHLLHWFEALSWMDRISEGVTMIITLRSLFDVSHCRLSDLSHTDRKLDLWEQQVD